MRKVAVFYLRESWNPALAPVLLNILQRSNAPGGMELPLVERLKTGRFPVSLVSTRDKFTVLWLVSGKTFRAKPD
jgi:hypothetical protein